MIAEKRSDARIAFGDKGNSIEYTGETSTRPTKSWWSKARRTGCRLSAWDLPCHAVLDRLWYAIIGGG